MDFTLLLPRDTEPRHNAVEYDSIMMFDRIWICDGCEIRTLSMGLILFGWTAFQCPNSKRHKPLPPQPPYDRFIVQRHSTQLTQTSLNPTAQQNITPNTFVKIYCCCCCCHFVRIITNLFNTRLNILLFSLFIIHAISKLVFIHILTSFQMNRCLRLCVSIGASVLVRLRHNRLQFIRAFIVSILLASLITWVLISKSDSPQTIIVFETERRSSTHCNSTEFDKRACGSTSHS